MIKNIFTFVLITFFSISCENEKKEYIYLSESLKSENIDTHHANWRDYIDDFDTISNEFGLIVFEDIIDSISDTAELKKLWGYNYRRADSIENTLAHKSNSFLDPNDLLSNDSYLMAIILREKEISIGATLFFDFENNEIGTFIIPDSAEDIKLDHKIAVNDLRERLKILKN